MGSMRIMNFEFEFSKLGVAVSLTLILALLKIGGTLNCAWWVTCLPLIILLGWYVIAIWLIGFIILIYFALYASTSDSDSDENGAWQERLKEALEEKEKQEEEENS